MKNELAKQMNQSDNFFMKKKILMYQRLVNQGMDGPSVQKWLDEAHSPEDNDFWVKTHMNNPNWRNPLKFE